MARVLVIALICIAASACRVQVVAPEKAAVITRDGSFICLVGQRCELQVDNFDVDVTLYAYPMPGYEFVKWSDADRHLCGGSTELGCNISTTSLDPDNPLVQDAMSSDSVVYVEPVLRKLDHLSPFVWMHEDWPNDPAPDEGR